MSSGESTPESSTYWNQTRRPLPCLVFLLPLLVLYELGVIWIGGVRHTLVRNGADAWMRGLLEQLGLHPAYVLPLGIVCIFILWHIWDRSPWRFHAEVIPGMLAESLLLALTLMIIGRLQDMAFERLELSRMVASLGPAPASLVELVSYVGAGIYEETLFRLLLLPLVYYVAKSIGTPQALATTIAVIASALAFSAAHYIGPPAEELLWFGFIFRWLAGLFFAGVFVLRGFAIVVGAHTAYDILVGMAHFHF